MIIYKDLLTGDELFSDIYPMKLIGSHKLIWELQGKRVTESSSLDESKFGANPSAEEAAEAADDASVSGVNIVLANRLQEVQEFTKKQYQEKIKAYMGKLINKWNADIKEATDEGRTDVAEKMKESVADFKANITADLKEIVLSSFKDKEFQFFVGESMEEDGMISLMTYPPDDAEGKPVLYFFKHGLKEMKV